MIQPQLNTLLNQIHRKVHLEELIRQLNIKIALQADQAELCRAAMLAEQNDVEKLEAGGIGTVLHKLTGRMEEKLDKERMEAQTASEEYKTAANLLSQTRRELEDAEKELSTVHDSRAKYIQSMQDRIQHVEILLHSSDNPEAEEALKTLLQLQRRRKSLREALLESDDADREAQKHLTLLHSAKNEPAIPDSHSYPEVFLQEIEIHTESMLAEITDIQMKLAQMGIDPGPHITIDAYLRAPVVFLINPGDESSAQHRLTEAIQQIEDLRSEIAQVSEKLTDALSQIEAAISRFDL